MIFSDIFLHLVASNLLHSFHLSLHFCNFSIFKMARTKHTARKSVSAAKAPRKTVARKAVRKTAAESKDIVHKSRRAK